MDSWILIMIPRIRMNDDNFGNNAPVNKELK